MVLVTDKDKLLVVHVVELAGQNRGAKKAGRLVRDVMVRAESIVLNVADLGSHGKLLSNSGLTKLLQRTAQAAFD